MTDVNLSSNTLDTTPKEKIAKCETEIANLVQEIDVSPDLLKDKNESNHLEDANEVITRVASTNKNSIKNSNNQDECASFQRISVRESSLENLTEDVTVEKLPDATKKDSIPENDKLEVDTTVNKIEEEKEEIKLIETKESIPINSEPCLKTQNPSKIRRTLTSIFGCCTVQTRSNTGSSTFKTDLSDPVNSTSPKERNNWLNCMRMKRCNTSGDSYNYRRSNSSHRSGGGMTCGSGSSNQGSTMNSPYHYETTVTSRCSGIINKHHHYRNTGSSGSSCNTSGNSGGPICSRNGDSMVDGHIRSKMLRDSLQSENGGHNLTKPVLLGPLKPNDIDKKCLIIDLDETLVHSSFKMVDKADFKVGVEIEGIVHTVYVLKRPHVDIFLQKMGVLYECVLFTASLAKYADPVADFLDKWRVFRYRLFREACVFHRGNYVKDLDMLGRVPHKTAILDNSPASYLFHPQHALQITSWFEDPHDTALLDLIPYLEDMALSSLTIPEYLASKPAPASATIPVSFLIPPQQPLQNPTPSSSSIMTNIASPKTTTTTETNKQQNPAISKSQPATSSPVITTISKQTPAITSTTSNTQQHHNKPVPVSAHMYSPHSHSLSAIFSPKHHQPFSHQSLNSLDLASTSIQTEQTPKSNNNPLRSQYPINITSLPLFAFRKLQRIFKPVNHSTTNTNKQNNTIAMRHASLYLPQYTVQDQKLTSQNNISMPHLTHLTIPPSTTTLYNKPTIITTDDEEDDDDDDNNINNNKHKHIRSVSLCLLHSLEEIPSDDDLQNHKFVLQKNNNLTTTDASNSNKASTATKNTTVNQNRLSAINKLSFAASAHALLSSKD